MIASIHQPNFLPWIGYFNKIKNSDLFVFLDDVQFERGKTYTSRTRILVNAEENWLTIPVINKSDLISIKDITVDKTFKWKNKHLRTIDLNYRKHPFFNEVFPLINDVYRKETVLLVGYNIPLIINICEYLGISTKFIKASEIQSVSNKHGWEKLLYILREVNADIYLSGTGEGSKRYVVEGDLIKNNIKLLWQGYEIRPYSQLKAPKFYSHLSIIDLLFNHGKNAVQYI